MAGEVVFVENIGDKPFTGRWANIKYVIDPGAIRLVPQEASWSWFGRPWLVDIDNSRRDRADEYTRLRYKYGAHGDNIMSQEERWEANKPKVIVKTVDDEVITTVIDDPDGDHLSPDIQTKAENQLLHERLATMERQMATLKRAAQVAERADASVAASGPVTEDADPTVRPPTIAETPIPNPEDVIPPLPDFLERNEAPDLPREVTEDMPTKVRAE